jgi:HAE1 family hydrophobic/amphiphilic exporter-1
MVDFFIHRPVFSTVCALLIILAGAVCIPTLPIAQFPNLAPPQVAVTAVYTGASAQTVESAVTTPLEQQVNGAEGMKYITSSSDNNGISQITATFDLNRDPDLAAVDIENRVNTASGRLPTAVKQVGVTVAKTSQNFVFGVAVFSPDGRYSTLFMSNYLDVYVRDSLKRVPGVADVLIFGERKYSMRLWLDPCAWPAAPSPPTMWSALSRSRTSKSPPGKSVPSPHFPASSSRSASAPSGVFLNPASSRTSSSRAMPMALSSACAMSVAPNSAPKTTAPT